VDSINYTPLKPSRGNELDARGRRVSIDESLSTVNRSSAGGPQMPKVWGLAASRSQLDPSHPSPDAGTRCGDGATEVD
jgi:hypothetical protein